MWDRDAVTLREVRKGTKPEVGDAVRALMGDGWTVVKAGHKFHLLCPCGPGGVRITVPGTPRVPSVAARKILNQAAKCPDQHEHLNVRPLR